MKSKKIKINAQLTRVFINWLTMIGYRGISRCGDLHFICSSSGKGFPRDVIIYGNGRLNKMANQLFAEFYSYVEEVA